MTISLLVELSLNWAKITIHMSAIYNVYNSLDYFPL